MIVIDALRTARLEVRLRELSMGDEIELCYLPDGSHEKALSEFLRLAVDRADTPSDRHVADPRAWTVGERYLALAHYNRAVREDGPNYAVTESTKLGDYLIRDRDVIEPVRFEAIGDKWEFRPATGAALEALEDMRFGSPLRPRVMWLLGLMAIQLRRGTDDERPDPIAGVEDYSAWLAKRMAVIRGLPASDSEALWFQYRLACEQGAQFFRLWYDDEGVIVMPKEAGGVLPPARFLVHAGFTELALEITGKSE
jgi:hypothetical protein